MCNRIKRTLCFPVYGARLAPKQFHRKLCMSASVQATENTWWNFWQGGGDQLYVFQEKESDTNGLVVGSGIFCCLQLSVPPTSVCALTLLRKMLKCSWKGLIILLLLHHFVLDSQLFIAIVSNIHIVSLLHAFEGLLRSVYAFFFLESLVWFKDYSMFNKIWEVTILTVLLCVVPRDFKQRYGSSIFYRVCYDMKKSHADETLWEIRWPCASESESS